MFLPKLANLFVLLSLSCLTPKLNADGPISFGGQASAFFVQGDAKSYLKDGVGNDIGMHLRIPFQGGTEIQTRLDWRTPPSPREDKGGHLYGACIGVDFLYYPFYAHQGLFIKGGFEGYGWSTNGSTGGQTTDLKSNGIQPLVGLGYRFNRMISIDSAIIFSKFGQYNAQLIQIGISIH
jgi:hypothetical protein